VQLHNKATNEPLGTATFSGNLSARQEWQALRHHRVQRRRHANGLRSERQRHQAPWFISEV